MAVALHRLDEHRDQYPKPLAADAIGRLPQHRQRLMHRLVVESPSRARALLCWRLIQYPQCVFTMISGCAYTCLGVSPAFEPVIGDSQASLRSVVRLISKTS